MYYQGSSEIQADGLQTLYLMNPNFTGGGYSDAQPPPPAGANMVILNYASGNPVNLASISSGGQQAQAHLVGVPLQASVAGAAVGSNNSHDLKLNHLSMHSQHEVPASASRGSMIPHFHHSLWGSLDQTGGGGSPSHHHHHHHHIPSGVVVGNNPGDVGTQLGFHRPVLSPTQQGLSLTLSSSQQPGYRSSTLAMDQNISVQNPVGILSPRSAGENLRGLSGSSSSVSAVSNGIPGLQSAVFGSKYLKAAQQLLDELVNVGQGSKNDSMEKGKEKGKVNGESTVLTAGEASQIGQIDTKDVTELTAAQRQEIQMKKAKLVSMLDEVEQRYRQYHHQMQIVVASFEQAAGIGSAKSYTHLALQTISKQFRCLKDAISTQIKSASKSLGEEESSLGGKFEGSRLKFVDQQLRQQRALQQLGMMQNNTWRPQRGLPERAVSVLRAWLFEHFLHPYPKDSDKQMLAKQTGLTRSQVSNWFINARVRLWKPMVEEMYMEETKNNQEQDGSESNKELGSNSTTPKENNVARNDQRNVLQSKQEKSSIGHDHASHTDIATSSLATTSPTNTSTQVRAGFGLIGALNMEGNVEKNSKKMRTEMQNSPSSILSVDMDMKFGETRKGLISSQRQTTKDSFSLMVNNTSTTHGSGFGAFTIGELGQFNPDQLTTGFHGNSVSLTLGLPPSENLALSGNHHEQNYLSDQNMELGSRLEMGAMEGHYDRVNKSQTSHSNMGYETINFDNRKRFAAQLLPDFVT